MASSSKSTVKAEISVNVDGLSSLSKALKQAADGTSTQLRTGLKSAGTIVQKQAQQNASWSKTIPGKIKVSVTQKQVAIQAKDGEAYSYEYSGWHGVFKQGYSNKPGKRPFMEPAATSKADDVASAILTAIADISL